LVDVIETVDVTETLEASAWPPQALDSLATWCSSLKVDRNGCALRPYPRHFAAYQDVMDGLRLSMPPIPHFLLTHSAACGLAAACRALSLLAMFTPAV